MGLAHAEFFKTLNVLLQDLEPPLPSLSSLIDELHAHTALLPFASEDASPARGRRVSTAGPSAHVRHAATMTDPEERWQPAQSRPLSDAEEVMSSGSFNSHSTASVRTPGRRQTPLTPVLGVFQSNCTGDCAGPLSPSGEAGEPSPPPVRNSLLRGSSYQRRSGGSVSMRRAMSSSYAGLKVRTGADKDTSGIPAGVSVGIAGEVARQCEAVHAQLRKLA